MEYDKVYKGSAMAICGVRKMQFPDWEITFPARRETQSRNSEKGNGLGVFLGAEKRKGRRKDSETTVFIRFWRWHFAVCKK